MLSGCFSSSKATSPKPSASSASKIPADVSEEAAARVLEVLAQDRERPSRIEFTGYQVSKEHAQRLASLPVHLRIPRSQWRAHPNYKGRFQMPNFHHDFRQEMQAIIVALWDAVGNKGSAQAHAEAVAERRAKDPQEAEPASDAAQKVARAATSADRLRAALDVWQGFKQHLDKHIAIEERAIFPNIKAHYPELDVSFLYDDHKSLLELEGRVIRCLHDAARKPEDTSLVVAALEDVIRFDREFVNHLGEEEEFIVPLCLLSEACVLHGPKP